ncbi:MAG: radical SAM protein [Bacteroidota bacterium]
MKVLLIQPPKSPRTIGGEDVFIYEPLALEYLAAGVKEDHDIRILDMRLEKDLGQVLGEFGPDIVGITAYTVHVNVVWNLFEQIKRWNPSTCTVVGGHHATVMPMDFVSPFIDVIVTGEGVSPFKEIVKRLERREKLDGIPGTAVTANGRLVSTPYEPDSDLDAFPFPDRTLTARYRGKYYSEWMKPLASIRTSKGCPYRCTFCAEWKIAGGHYLKRKPRRVVEELGEIGEEYVFFADDESLVDAPRMSELARRIKEAGIRKRYFLYGRSDTIARNPRLLDTWRDVGLERVFIGLEFFRDEDLAYVGKSSTASDNERAVRMLQDLGIDVYASFIVRPDFSHADFFSFRQYCRDLGLNYASFAVLTPLPGTDLYEEVRDQIVTRNYDDFDFIHTLLPTALPIKEFYREYRQLFMHAIPMRRQISQLKKYALRDIPGTILKGRRFYDRLATIHLEYGR